MLINPNHTPHFSPTSAPHNLSTSALLNNSLSQVEVPTRDAISLSQDSQTNETPVKQPTDAQPIHPKPLELFKAKSDRSFKVEAICQQFGSMMPVNLRRGTMIRN